MKIIKQHDERDCGAACLATIAANYGLYHPLSYYRELTKTDSRGVSIYGLIDAAQQMGFIAEALSGNPEELMSGLSNNDISFPFIAHIVTDAEMMHYVAVFGYKNGRLLIADPGKGRVQISIEAFMEKWTGYIVTIAKGKDFVKGDYRPKGLSRFFVLLKGQYRKLVCILLISLIISLIGIAGAFIFEVVIDKITTAPTTAIYTHGEMLHQSNECIGDHSEYAVSTSNLDAIFLSVILLYVVQCVIQYVRGRLIISLSKKIDIRLSLGYYNHIVDLPVSSISDRQTGEYLSRFSDATSIRLAISNATMTLILDSLMALACGIILYKQNSQLFPITIVILLLYTLIILCFKKPVERSNRDVMAYNANLQSFFKESLDGISTIKATCSENRVKKQTEKKFFQFVNSAQVNSLLSLAQETISTGIELVGTAIVLWFGFRLIVGSSFSVGELLTYYALLGYFLEPVKNLIGLQPEIQTAIVAAERLSDVLDLKIEDRSRYCKMPTVSAWDIEGVDFRYGNNELTLTNVSISVNRGEKIAIVGESGCGKTTLAKLLLQFYVPEAGSITVDNVPLSKYGIDEIRRNIAYVDQDTFLFADTIENNLRLGAPNASDGDLQNVCKLTHADEFIDQLPLGIKTPLDENGGNLSGGQKQRLSIARSLLKNPQLLILDEATSNLDTITEASIRDAIMAASENIACIIIAHKLSTIKQCDRIYVMRDGGIVEKGTHDDLIKKGGLYTSMWKMQ